MVLAGLNNTFWDGGWLTPRLRRRRDGSVEGGTAAPRPLGHARCRTREPAVEPRTRSRVAVESAATPRRAAADEAATPRAKHSSAGTRNGRPPAAGTRAKPNAGAGDGTTTAEPSRGRPRGNATRGCRRRSGCPQQPREHCTTRHLGLKAARGRRSGCPSSRRSTARRSGAWGPRPHGAATPKAKHSGAEARDGRSPAASTRA